MTAAGVLCGCEWDEAGLPLFGRSDRVDGTS